jgi:hypothetical protein
VELIAFKSAIDERVFQEDIRRNMVEAADRYNDRLPDYERLSTATTDPNAKPDAVANVVPPVLLVPSTADASAADSGSSGQTPSVSLPKPNIRGQEEQLKIDKTMAEADKHRIDEQIKQKQNKDLPALDSQRATAEANLAKAQHNLQAMINRGLSEEDLGPYSDNVGKAQKVWGGIRGQIRTLKEEINRLQAQSVQLERFIAGTDQHIVILSDKAKTFEDFQKDYRTFMSVLKKARKAEDIPPAGEFSFVQREYLDVEKLSIIFDLMNGHPPRWPEFAADSRILTNDVDIKAMKELEARNAAENGHMRWINWIKYLSFMLIALLIPAVALVYKITATEDLASYFSNSYQAARLHPEALEHEVTRETMNRKQAVVTRPAYGAGDD